MIKSMTGFGRYELTGANRRFTVEIKSVNHRYLDIGLKMPKSLGAFETAIRDELKGYIGRGKVDVYITVEDTSEGNFRLKYNRALAEEYVKYLRQMAEEFSVRDDLSVSVLARCPEVLEMEEQEADEEELWKSLREALSQAAKAFVDSREREGERLKEDILLKCDEMLSHVRYITERAPEIIKEYKRGLREKIDALLQDTQLDEARLASEVTIYADKICIDEELVRLKSHIEAVRDALSEKAPVGRKLDFIAQEMNREANTILSKSSDLAVSDHAIGLKTDIEKVREQIQNIE